MKNIVCHNGLLAPVSGIRRLAWSSAPLATLKELVELLRLSKRRDLSTEVSCRYLATIIFQPRFCDEEEREQVEGLYKQKPSIAFVPRPSTAFYSDDDNSYNICMLKYKSKQLQLLVCEHFRDSS